MRRVIVSLLIGALCLATVMPPGHVWAQEPAQEEAETQAQPWNRDLTPYIIGIGAVVGVIAFNIAAPPLVGLGSRAAGAVRNVRAVIVATRQRLVGGAVARPAVTTATAATTATTGRVATAAQRPLVPPLTQSMLAQAQIAAVSAAAAGAVAVASVYAFVNWTTGAAP